MVSDPNLFDGKHFLVFQAVDKQSGIDHYEVLEVRSGHQPVDQDSLWERAESPYELKDQGLRSDIYVRAVDRSRNFIVAKVSARHPQAVSGSWPFGMMLLILIFFIILLLLWSKRRIFQKA